MVQTRLTRFALTIFWYLPILAAVQGISLDEELTLTWPAKLKLDEFRERVEKYLTEDYMKEELYLVRWLRARDFNVDAAEQMFKTNLQWRKNNRMDTINQEDWSAFHRRYKYYDHGVDKKGQPFAYLGLGAWDVRRAVVSGEHEELGRYLDGAIQSVCSKPYQLRKEGKNITQVDFIVDLKGFTLTQQGCLGCIPFYIRFVSTYENYFPGCPDRVLVVNTPTAFEIILQAIRPIFSEHTRKALQIFGPNRNDWGPKLYSIIDKEQLPPELGGNDFSKYEEREEDY